MSKISLSALTNSKGTKFTGALEWSVTKTEATRVKISFTLRAWLSAGYTYATLDGTVKSGSTQVGSGSWGGASSSYFDGDGADVCSGSFWMTFDASGNASTTLSASVTIRNSGSFSGTITGSGTVSQKAPYGASTFTVNKDPVKHGEKLIFSITRDAGTLTHTLYYWNGVSANWVQIASGVGTSYTWTVPDLASIMPNATSGKLYLLCTTYNGSTSLGSNQINITMNVQDPTTPAIASNTATMGTAKTITCTRLSSNFKVVLEFTMGNKTETIKDGQVDSFTWTPSYDYAKEIPNLTSGTGTLTCKTYNGTALVGTKSISVSLTVPENDTTRPKFTSDGLTLSVVTELTGDLAGLYIRGRTGLKAEFTASSDYSTIQNYAVSAGSVSAKGNPATIETLMNEGTVQVTATVTDARGFSRTVITSISVLPYQKPKITPYSGYSEVICERAKSTGELSADGTYLAIRAGKNFSSFVMNGTERNSCQLRYRYKVASAEEYGQWVVLLGSNSAQTQTSILVGGVVPSTSTSYDIELEAIDALGGRHTLHFQIMTSQISFVLYDGVDGAGFGKYPEAPHVVDIAAHMTLLVRGKLVVLGADWEPLPFASGVYESSYDLGRVEDCKYQVKEGNHVYVAFNCSFTHSGTAITVNSTPIPEDYRPARTVRAICPVNGNGTALVRVKPDGYIQVESVERPGENGTHPVLWIDAYLDYWT